MIAFVTGLKESCPKLTAPSIISSDNSIASDSTIKTAESVPATTRSNLHSSFNCSFVGFRTYSSFMKPTLAAAIGPIKGTPDRVNAAETAIMETISGSFSPS